MTSPQGLEKTAADSSSSQDGVAKELEELAALERELGLDSTIDGKREPGESTNLEESRGAIGEQEEDDLDDLEKYLNSIQ